MILKYPRRLACRIIRVWTLIPTLPAPSRKAKTIEGAKEGSQRAHTHHYHELQVVNVSLLACRLKPIRNLKATTLIAHGKVQIGEPKRANIHRRVQEVVTLSLTMQ